jgi:hypothetical protein
MMGDTLGLSANRKTASRRSLEIQYQSGLLIQRAVVAAALFRFLRQPSRPNAPRPVTKSGRAAGSGVADTAGVAVPLADVDSSLTNPVAELKNHTAVIGSGEVERAF